MERQAQASQCDLLLLTGDGPRDDLLSFKLQARFPDLRISWLVANGDERARPHDETRLRDGLRCLWRSFRDGDFFSDRPRAAADRLATPATSATSSASSLYEVERLARGARIAPQKAATPATFQVEALSPDLVVTNLASAHQLAPSFTSALTLQLRYGPPPYSEAPAPVLRALYHRNLSAIGASLWIQDPDRRLWRAASIRLQPDDTIETCIVRSEILGAELVCEAIACWFRHRAFAQGASAPAVSIDQDELPDEADYLVRRDLRGGLISRYLSRQANW